MSDAAIELYEYHSWANRAILNHLGSLPENVWRQETAGIYPSISGVMSHMYAMDAMWLCMLRQRPFDEARALLLRLKEQTSQEGLEDVRERFLHIESKYRQWLLTEDLNDSLLLAHPVHGVVNASLSRIIQHIVNHGAYYRGHLSAMLCQLGHADVPTDYLLYLYTG